MQTPRFMDIPKLIVDPEFLDLLPAMTPDEKDGLEKSILKDGCVVPLIAWGDILVDGHHRKEICEKHGLEYTVVQKDFENRDHVKLFIIANQINRRNITLEQRSYMIGVQYKIEKKEIPNPEGAGGKSGKIVGGQNDPHQKTAEKIAKQHHVSPRTVKRAEKFADALDQMSPEERAEVLAGKSEKTKEEIIRGKSKSPAPKLNEPEPLIALKRWWRRANKKTRNEFLEWIKSNS